MQYRKKEAPSCEQHHEFADVAKCRAGTTPNDEEYGKFDI